jgi:hypothetical protein
MNPDFDVLSACLELTSHLLQSKLTHPVIRLSEKGQDIISSEFLQTLFIKLQSLSIKVIMFVNEKAMCRYIRAEAFVVTKSDNYLTVLSLIKLLGNHTHLFEAKIFSGDHVQSTGLFL